MVGGRIIENAIVKNSDGELRRRLWCVDGADECAVYVESSAEAASLQPGETCWWQSGTIYARNDTLKLAKIGFSFDPRKSVAA